MANNVTITLDTAAPAGASVLLEAGAATVSSRDITAAIATSDGVTTGYQMKIYGDVDDAFDTANYRTLEANAPWVAYNASKAVRLAAGDGVKTVRVKIRDDVWNTTGELTDTITLDTTVPVINITAGPTPARISKQTGKRAATITWQSDLALSAYKVKLVASASDPHTAGTQLGTTGGSLNVTGGATGATTPVTSTIDGADLETAGVNGALTYNGAAGIVKVFGQAASNGVWSI